MIPPPALVQPESPIAQLHRLTVGLIFISESEAPLTIVRVPPTESLAAALRAETHRPADTPVREQPLDEIFFERVAPGEGAGEIDVKQAPIYAALLAWLRKHVREARAVRVGAGAPQDLFLIGQTPDGSWLGVRTTTVDT